MISYGEPMDNPCWEFEEAIAIGATWKMEYAEESNLFRFCARHVYHSYTCRHLYVRSCFDSTTK